MRIVITIPSLCMCGAERVAVSLANWLSKKNNEVFLLSLSDEKSQYEIDEKVKVFYKNYRSSEIKGNKLTRNLRKAKLKLKYVLGTLKKIKPDLIFEMLYIPMIYIIIYKLFYNKNVVIIGSERNNPKMNKGFLKKIFSYVCPKICDGYIFQTKRVMDMYSKKIQQKSKVIANAVSNMYVYDVPEKKVKQKIISNLAKLNPQKGQDTLIRAFKIVHDKYKDYNLVIYGEGQHRSYLESIVKELELDDCVLLPGKDNKAIFKVNESEIFVFSSRFEGMPNALIEALAIGMPCISTDCIAGPSELIDHGKTGLLVEVDNVDELAEQIIYLIENKKYASELGKNAKEKILKKHSAQNIYSQYYNYFKKVYKQKRGVIDE